jgi:N-acetylmuramoyl-L-alanine amidase
MFVRLKKWFKGLLNKEPRTVVLPAPPLVSIPDERLPSAHDNRQFHLGVIVGHTKDSPGAALVGQGIFEYQFNTEIANMMKRLAPRELKVDVIFRDGVGIAGAYAKAEQLGCDGVIELHFNAFNGQAFGTETLCTQDANDVEFAHIVQKAMCDVYGRTGKGNRGVLVISRSARGGGNVHAFRTGANCLTEPFFGDNPSEVRMALAKKTEYAQCLLQATLLYARKKDFIK